MNMIFIFAVSVLPVVQTFVPFLSRFCPDFEFCSKFGDFWSGEMSPKTASNFRPASGIFEVETP